MDKVNETVVYVGLGYVITIVLSVIFAFYPALIVTLSVVDKMYDWQIVTTPREMGMPPLSKVYDWEGKEFSEGELFRKRNESYMNSPFILIDKEEFSNACWAGAIIGSIMWICLFALIKNIREAWPVVVGAYILCFYPFTQWLGWAIDPESGYFPGVDWIPFL